MRRMRTVYRMVATLSVTIGFICTALTTSCVAQAEPRLNWQALPPIPDELGLAGPIVGVHDELLIVGGGANFAKPVWENVKRWHNQLFVLDLRASSSAWRSVGPLPAAIAYCACASTPWGVAVIGGNDDERQSAECWLLKPQRHTRGSVTVDMQRLADLPQPLAYAQAVWLNDCLVVMSGQTGSALATAIAGGWQLKIGQASSPSTNQWEPISACPGGPRAFAMMSVVPAGQGPTKVLLMGGRRQTAESIEFLSDVWQYDLADRTWAQLINLPVPVSAGGAGVVGRFVAVVSGDDGSLFKQTELLKDQHPGFAKRTWLLDVATSRWQSGGASPANQVTTPPVAHNQRLIVASGEVRPRVRTSQVWEVAVE